MTKITIKDIAKALSVSISTVSKALSDSHEISDATKARIRNYAEANSFSINKVAQSLKLGRTNTIAVIACAINNDFVSQILEGIQMAAVETKYDIIIMQSMEDVNIERSCIEMLKARGIDGLLISPVSENSNVELLEKLQKSNIPVVLFDRTNSRLDTYKFGVKNFDGAYEGTVHLIKQGSKHILHITGTQISVANDRLNGFKAAISEFGLQFTDDQFIACNLKDTVTIDSGIRKALKAALKSKNKPDAIFCATDVITIRTLGILADMNVKVPEDIAVIGFANTNAAFAMNPSLSTITQPAKEIGYLSMSQLVKLIKSKKSIHDYEMIELDTSMHVRKSSLKDTRI